jgi:hypothetical protein
MSDCWLRVSISRQQLELLEAERLLQCYPISTARNGPGEQEGSGCTPALISLNIGRLARNAWILIGGARRLTSWCPRSA